MSQDRAAAVLRAHGFDVRTDGLGNVLARVYRTHRDGTSGYKWQLVPIGSAADVMQWIGN
jgi:hypothetical protein